ncbi:PepSY domain-containing protein [Rheinheimera sp.]|uniref:PepSY-associated TM helix domain-containing protein n=1 Tax=Rheinheimera sp. TaxID=1869214 RepID=UPI00307DDA20
MSNHESQGRVGHFYQSVWRWHFYAGLIVAPFLLILSVTGAIYLFNDEIDDWLYPEQRFVATQLPALPASQLIEAALSPFPGATATRLDQPTAPGRSAKVFITTAEGEVRKVYVDPGTAQALGSQVPTETLVGFADVAHGSLLLGEFGDSLVELMACWSFILLITGLYLWWPRQSGQWLRLFIPSLSARGRAAWRSWHGVTGVWSALLLGFLILTGLPWANVWGDLFRATTDMAGLGYPAYHRSHGARPQSVVSESSPQAAEATLKQQLGTVPWTLEKQPMPVSDNHAMHQGAGQGASAQRLRSGIGIDGAVARLAELGLNPAYRMFLPKDAQGVYTAYTYPNQPQGQRTVHLDQYSGAVLGDVRYADYGVAAKAVELGVQLHMGNYFGLANQLLMLLGCLGGLVMAISGPVMWWKRRPPGRLAAPRKPATSQLKTVAWLVVVLGLLFPLAGASIVLILLLDWLLVRKPGPAVS